MTLKLLKADSINWNLSYGIRKKDTSSKSLDVSEVTVGSWIERLREL